MGDAGGKDAVDTSDGAAAAAASKRGARKKRRAKPPRVIPTIRVYVGTFVHSTADNALVVLERWMIGVDAGKVVHCISLHLQYFNIFYAFSVATGGRLV